MSDQPEQIPLFTVVDAETFARSLAPKQRSRRSPKTEPRTQTVWFDLVHHTGFCTVPRHDEVQRSLHPAKQEVRQKYPVRHVFTIGEFDVCRDCFLAEADK